MTKVVNIGGVKIGGSNGIAIQSMTNVKTKDVSATLNQIFDLNEVGCDIVRVSVLDERYGDKRNKKSMPDTFGCGRAF